MRNIPGPALFQPEQYRRHFKPEQIIDHLTEVLEIVEQIDSGPGIPMDLRVSVFNVVQAMVSSMEHKDAQKQQTAALLGVGEGLGVR